MNRRFHLIQKKISGTLAAWAGAVLVYSALALAQSAPPNTKPLSVTPKAVPPVPRLNQPPAVSTEEEEEEGIPPRMDPPVDPRVRPESIKPVNPPTQVKILPASGFAPAAGTFTLFRNTTLSSAPIATNTFRPIEPSFAQNGRVILYTTNNYAAVSGDRGQTFTYIDPATFFPAANGGFGGDQVIYYARTHGAMFWLLQYNADNATNTQRLAVARSQADVINNNWIYYDFSPASFAYTSPPTGAVGFWDDFPNLAVSDNFLYLTTNVFPRILPNPTNQCAGTCPTRPCPAACGGVCTNVCTGVGAVTARLPLDQLEAGGSLSGGRYYTDTNSGYRCTHGAQSTMYWGSHNSNTQVRIYRWDESSNSVASDNVDHDAYNVGTMTAASPDGNDFAAFADSRILGAWVANGVIGFMWGAAQGGGFSYPHVEVVRFKESDRTKIGQGQVFNNSFAFLYPSVHPNDRGDLGGTMAWGGGANYPNALAWIADDINGGVITPLENLSFAAGSAGPAGNRWGDYFSTRVTPPYGNIWAGTGYVLSGTDSPCQGAPTASCQPHYVWFGRERDTPPPTNTIFIGAGATSPFQDGSFAHPYSTVTAGNFAAMAGDSLLIGSGTYPEVLTFQTPVSIDTLLGPAQIGK